MIKERSKNNFQRAPCALMALTVTSSTSNFYRELYLGCPGRRQDRHRPRPNYERTLTFSRPNSSAGVRTGTGAPD